MDTNSIPGLTLSPSLDAKLNALDDNLQPLEKEEVCLLYTSDAADE